MQYTTEDEGDENQSDYYFQKIRDSRRQSLYIRLRTSARAVEFFFSFSSISMKYRIRELVFRLYDFQLPYFIIFLVLFHRGFRAPQFIGSNAKNINSFCMTVPSLSSQIDVDYANTDNIKYEFLFCVLGQRALK